MLSRAPIPWLACVLSAVVLTSCGSDPTGESVGGACESNPEPAVVTQGSNLNGSNLNGSNLNGSNLNGSNLNGSDGQGSNLNGVGLNGVSLQGIELQGSNLNGMALNASFATGSVAGVPWNGLVGSLPDGQDLGGEELLGTKLTAVLSDGSTIELTISAFETSAAGDLAYYRLDYQGQNLCGGDEMGMFLPGVWDERAARHDELTVGGVRISASFSCPTGVLAKCVVWGYAPWNVGSELHQTCTRMARADYCGSGISFTKNGTLIDVYDAQGIQTPTADATLSFEAGWGENGAVCVSRPRFDANTPDGASVMPSCWATLPKCNSFEEARGKGATIGNSSRPQSRTICSD